MHVLDGVEDERSSAVAQQPFGCGGRFDHGAVRREVAVEDGDAGLGLERSGARADHFGVPDPRVGEVLDERLAGDAESSGIEQVLHLAQHRAQARPP